MLPLFYADRYISKTFVLKDNVGAPNETYGTALDAAAKQDIPRLQELQARPSAQHVVLLLPRKPRRRTQTTLIRTRVCVAVARRAAYPFYLSTRRTTSCTRRRRTAPTR